MSSPTDDRHWPLEAVVFVCAADPAHQRINADETLPDGWVAVDGQTYCPACAAGLVTLSDPIVIRLARVEALAEKWNSTPDYAPSEYDQGRVDQRHDMTGELIDALSTPPDMPV
jgi:hypothetical protein